MTYQRARGSRAQVMNGSAHHTPGGLTKKHLKYNKHGRIVSKKMSLRAKKENRLVKAGYIAKKGHFQLFRKSHGRKSHGRKSHGRKSRKMRGGCVKYHSLSPSDYDGKDVGTSGVALQFVAGNSG
jgi:hypothetical protein